MAFGPWEGKNLNNSLQTKSNARGGARPCQSFWKLLYVYLDIYPIHRGRKQLCIHYMKHLKCKADIELLIAHQMWEKFGWMI